MRDGRKIDRRGFLNGVGTVAVASALGTSPSAATANPERLSVQQQSNRYDFDAVYSRLGTNSSKWDHQISLYGREHVQVGMGTADQDFRSAPAITMALRERVQHENYGYLTVPNSSVSAITQTPASGPTALVTTPDISVSAAMTDALRTERPTANTAAIPTTLIARIVLVMKVISCQGICCCMLPLITRPLKGLQRYRELLAGCKIRWTTGQ